VATTAVDIVVKVVGGNKVDKLASSLKGVDLWSKKTATSSKQAADGVKRAGDSAGKASNQFNNLKRAIAGIGIAALAKQLIGNAAQFEQLQLRIKVLSQEYGEFGRIQDFITQSSKQFGQSQAEAAQGIADVYARLRPLGIELNEIETVYKGFTATAIASGTSAEAASSAFLQLSQALGSGRLQGDEFRSIAEQVPGILQLVSRELGVTVGELKQLGADGKITSDVLINALAKGFELNKGKIDEILQNSPAQKFKDFQNAVSELSNAVGSELLPAIIPAVEAATDLVRAIGDLPEPVKKGAAEAVILAAKIWLVNKAFTALIGLKAGITAVLASAAAGSTAAGNAAGAATIKINAMAAALARLAAIGIVTVGVNYVVNGIASGSRQEDLLKQLESGELENSLQNLPYQQGLDRLRQEEKTLTDLLAKRDDTLRRFTEFGSSAAAAIPGFGPARLGQLKGELNELNLQIQKSQTILSSKLAPETSPQTGSGGVRNVPTGGTSSKGGGGSAAAPATDDINALNRQIEGLKKLQAINDKLNLAKLEGNELLIESLEGEKQIQELLNSNIESIAGMNTEQGRLLQSLIGEIKLRELRNNLQTEADLREKARAEAVKDALRPLEEQRRILEATLNGRGEEEKRLIEIERLSKGLPEAEREKIAALVNGNAELQKQVDKANQLKALYASIAQSVGGAIEDSIVAAIDSAVDSTKDLGQALQEIASSLLKDVGRMLLKAGIGGLGSGFGIPGFSAGGRPEVNAPSIVGENGPELFVPDTNGTIQGSNAFDAARQAMTTSSSVQSSTAALDREQEQIEMMQNPSPLDVRFETYSIGGMDVVTREEAMKISEQSAKKARAQVFADMRNKPSTRAQLGIG